MRRLRLYTGNRLEQLARRIADVLVEPLSSPLEKEIIVVQSKGMEHWLSIQLALKHGICANCAFPFPNRILNELFDRVLPEEKGSGIYETDAMAWKIMDALPEFVTRPGFETLAAYLQDDSKGVKLFQLSSHLAEIFSNYIIYRPDMLLAWQEGRHVMPDHLAGLEYWQSLVWRAVCAGEEQAHLAARRDRFLKALNPSTATHLPERISLFGISYLPPFHLEVFHALSCFIPVHVFVLNPCRQYWGDIRSQSEIGMISEKSGHRPSELHLEEGNSILAAMGGVGRELFENLQSFELQETELFEDISGDTLLECIQADILDLKNPQPGRPRTVNTRDDSVQIHSCHSPMREVEVLRDNLLALLDEDPDLKPQDIVVMSPDIEIYAPYIHAVFDIPRNSPAFIPFTVSDRSLKAESSLAQPLIGILELNAGRFEATKVIALLESEQVRKKFGLHENDLELILRWVQESGIRWGYDEDWKRESGMPDAYENTWRFGLDRLLLGYAMPSEGTRWFGSILPYDDMEGDSSRVLGSFLTFLTTLFSRVMSFREKKTLKLWSETLTALLDEFFEADELLAPRMQSVRAALQRLGDIQEITATGVGIGCEVIKAYVKNALEDAHEGRAYLSGGVTFCTMLAMRSIPFQVVCMIGMNHADFPRQQRAKGFNLICRRPRRGDCSVRNKDLYLFLEAILSARKTLYISYVGQSIEDNSPIPPAVPVSILLDYLESGFLLSDGRPVPDGIVRKHCLQAFSPRYFSGGTGLFSFSRENAEAARSLAEKDVSERVFIPGRISEPGDEWRTVDVGLLCRFYRNPCRFFLTRRLSMGISETSSFLDDCEPVELSDLELYRLRNEHVTRILEGADHELSYRIMKMSGRLPHGAPGEILFSRIRHESESFVRAVKKRIADTMPMNTMVDLPLGPFTITGSLITYGPAGIVLFRPARTRASDLFTAWIHHLILCSLPGSPDVRSCYISRDEAVEFRRVENSPEILITLLERYWDGMSRPLRFFPETSLKYANPGRQADVSREERLKRARSAWEGTPQFPGEARDLAYRICFGEKDPLDREFEEISESLLGPLIVHRGAGRL